MAEKDRIRTTQFKFTLLEEEKALLDKNASEFGLSRADYLRKIILYGGMTIRPYALKEEDNRKLIYELNKIGNNINQIAYNTNVKSHTSNAEMQSLKKYYFQLLKMIGELPFMDEVIREEWQRQVFALIPKEWAKELDIKEPEYKFEE